MLGWAAGATSGTNLGASLKDKGRHCKVLTVGGLVRFAFEKIILAAFKGNRFDGGQNGC